MLGLAPTDIIYASLAVPPYGGGMAIILPTGKIAIIRHLTPDDNDPIIEFVHHLSDQSVERRFLRSKATVLAELDRTGARNLVEFDRQSQTALVATIIEQGEEHFIAVARLARDPQAPAQGELGITVRDDFQGLGLGAFLLQLLGQAARAQGMTRMVGYTQSSNKPILRMLNKLDMKHTVRFEHGEAHFVIEIA